MTDHVDVGGVTRAKVGPTTLPDDGYPKIIRDQREQYPVPVESVADAVDYEEAWLERQGKIRKLDPEQRAVVPYISKSRWVADCPACNGGIACWDENPQGCCMTCGLVFKVAWQDPALRSKAIRLLHGRPHQWRDWHAGESVERLAVENKVLFDAGVITVNGLELPDNVTVPESFISPHEYLEHLKTLDSKRLVT